MKKSIRYHFLGLKPYNEVFAYQIKLFDQLADRNRIENGSSGHLIFCEHKDVFTLGKSGQTSNLLINEQILAAQGIQFVKTDRGGDITYHGPGQLVGYPVFNLVELGISPRNFVWSIEEAIIDLLKDYGISGYRFEGATGVWLKDGEGKQDRKICALGLKISRGVTMHGFALNINTDLEKFRMINPCGFTDKKVTSMQKELDIELNFEEVIKKLLLQFNRTFNIELHDYEETMEI